MKMKRIGFAATMALGIIASGAQAKGTPEEVAKLGKELTAVGAIRAGNADGSVPEWTGEKNFTAKQKAYKRKELEDLRKSKPEELENQLKDTAGPDVMTPLFEITKANMAKYDAVLTVGHKELLKKYPSYKMKMYKSIRTAYWPRAIEDATIANANTATLVGTDSVKDARLGFPFPIPKSGAEPLWNHKLKFRGSNAKRFNNQAIVKPDGTFLITKLVEDVKFKYANIPEPGDGKLLALYMSEVMSPPRVAGQITLVHETADQATGGRLAWIFSPGQGRVNRAPDVGYDNPAIGTDNEQFNDQIDVFNGALDRYDWKLVGRKDMYIPYNSYLINSPRIKYKQLLTPFHVNQDFARYELHRVWVIDATLRKGTSHSFGRRTFYIDEDSWSIAAVDCYDKRGALWKVQEAHLLTAPFIPTTTGVPELIYDLQSNRYFATAMVNEDEITDFEVSYEDRYFDPSALKRKARSR